MRARCLACGRLGSHMVGCPRAKPRNGSTRQWRKTRAAILRRDDHTCQRCGHRDTTGKTLDVDHIIRKADGGSDDPSNLRVLCAPCNRGRGTRW